MHFDDGLIPEDYRKYTSRKIAFILILLACLALVFLTGLSSGTVHIPLADVIRTLSGSTVSKKFDVIIYDIRLLQVAAAAAAGAGLAVSGAVMQSVLRNPLGSPFTLGISNASAFGAALSVMLLGTGKIPAALADRISISNPYATAFSAFVFSMGAAVVILAVAKLKQSSPEIMILTGVALGSLFTAATMLLQFFADDVQLAAMVFWTFGDAARADRSELLLISMAVLAAVCFFMFNAWNYNACGADIDEMSGGELQKVSIARAFVQETDLFLLDEPTSSLDLKNQEEILGFVRRVVKEHHIAAVMTMHDLNTALRFSDKYLFLQNGTIQGAGEVSSISEELVESVYGLAVEVITHNGRPFIIPETRPEHYRPHDHSDGHRIH